MGAGTNPGNCFEKIAGLLTVGAVDRGGLGRPAVLAKPIAAYAIAAAATAVAVGGSVA